MLECARGSHHDLRRAKLSEFPLPPSVVILGVIVVYAERRPHHHFHRHLRLLPQLTRLQRSNYRYWSLFRRIPNACVYIVNTVSHVTAVISEQFGMQRVMNRVSGSHHFATVCKQYTFVSQMFSRLQTAPHIRRGSEQNTD